MSLTGTFSPIGAGRVKRGQNPKFSDFCLSFVLYSPTRAGAGSPIRDLQFGREVAFPYRPPRRTRTGARPAARGGRRVLVRRHRWWPLLPPPSRAHPPGARGATYDPFFCGFSGSVSCSLASMLVSAPARDTVAASRGFRGGWPPPPPPPRATAAGNGGARAWVVAPARTH